MSFVVVHDDPYYNPGKSYFCSIIEVNNGGAVGALRDTTMTVIDDEQPPTVSVNDVTVVEGTGTPNRSAVFTVSLSRPLTVFTSVRVLVHDESAKSIADYLWSGQSANFFAGQTSTTISVAIVGDDVPEGDETFQVELIPSAPVQPGKLIGYCVIVDDDDVIAPPFQRIGKGEKGIINIRLKSPATVPAQVLFQASEVDLLDVPDSVTIPPGASEADVQFTGRKVGAGSIRVTLPPSRGGRSDQLLVTVHDNTTLTIDPLQLNLSLGESANVTARVDPVPAAPLRVINTAAKPGIVSIPDLVTTGADGRVVIPVRSLGLGSTTVNIALLDIDGGAFSDLGVNVTLGLGPVATSVVTAAGRESGGASVRLNGFNFSNLCAVS
ncbi:MAG TPA: Calx-beta domain-containing protein, partial [Thermoanaerobaculia bacterium]